MSTVVDPVCEAPVLAWWSAIRGLSSDVRDKRYYFCSRQCKDKFDAHPASYTMAEDLLRASDDGMAQPFDTPLDLPE
jgi:YHS domain-containing protein